MEFNKCCVHQGAEAKLYVDSFFGKPVVIKERFAKKYRHPKLDENLTKERTKAEAKYLVRCRKIGIHTPAVYFVDLDRNSIYMEHFPEGVTVRELVHKLDGGCEKLKTLAEQIGTAIGRLHANDIIHGDLTTSNMLFCQKNGACRLILIDFGLSHTEFSAEDKGVDLYVLQRAILASHPRSENFFADILSSYSRHNPQAKEVLTKLDEVRLRGRKRTMVG